MSGTWGNKIKKTCSLLHVEPTVPWGVVYIRQPTESIRKWGWRALNQDLQRISHGPGRLGDGGCGVRGRGLQTETSAQAKAWKTKAGERCGSALGETNHGDLVWPYWRGQHRSHSSPRIYFLRMLDREWDDWNMPDTLDPAMYVHASGSAWLRLTNTSLEGQHS